jgi:hypothetical protein
MLVFAIIVVLLACLAIALVRSIPGIPSPLNWILPVLILLVAIVLIANRSGVL